MQLHGELTSVQPSRAVLRPRPLPCPASLASCMSTAFVHELKPSPVSALLPQFLEALKTGFGITTDSRKGLLESRGPSDLAGLQDAPVHTLSVFSSFLSSFLHPCIFDPFYLFIHFHLASSMYEHRAPGHGDAAVTEIQFLAIVDLVEWNSAGGSGQKTRRVIESEHLKFSGR